eukprot:ctg_672.g370
MALLEYAGLPPFVHGARRAVRVPLQSLRSLQAARRGYGGRKVDWLAVMVTRVCRDGVVMEMDGRIAAATAAEDTRSGAKGRTLGCMHERCERDLSAPSELGHGDKVDVATGELGIELPGATQRPTVRRPRRSAPNSTRYRDVLVTLRDPTLGTVHGTVHADVLEWLAQTHEEAKRRSAGPANAASPPEACIEPGTVLLLRDVTVLRLARSGSHVNIHPMNVVRVFPARMPMSKRARSCVCCAVARSPWSLLDAYRREAIGGLDEVTDANDPFWESCQELLVDLDREVKQRGRTSPSPERAPRSDCVSEYPTGRATASTPVRAAVSTDDVQQLLDGLDALETSHARACRSSGVLCGARRSGRRRRAVEGGTDTGRACRGKAGGLLGARQLIAPQAATVVWVTFLAEAGAAAAEDNSTPQGGSVAAVRGRAQPRVSRIEIDELGESVLSRRRTDDSSCLPSRGSYHVYYDEVPESKEKLYRGERLHSAVRGGQHRGRGGGDIDGRLVGGIGILAAAPRQRAGDRAQRWYIVREFGGGSGGRTGGCRQGPGVAERRTSVERALPDAHRSPPVSVMSASPSAPLSHVPAREAAPAGVDTSEQVAMRFSRAERRPKFVSHYVLGAKLGEGAYAKVREAMDTRTLRIVACKIVDKHFLRRVRGGLENVRREIAIMRRLDHSHTMRLLDVIDDEKRDKLYMFMELSNGCTVHELIDRAPQKRLPPGQAQSFLAQLLEALEYVHSQNVVHRDIKPANLMLATDGHLKLADFGVAEFLDKFDAEGGTTRTVGSPAFQAPEIAKGEGVFLGRKVDAWATGVTLYMMLAGEPPFKGTNYFELFQRISEGAFHMPEALADDDAGQDLLRRLMALDPHERAAVEDVREHPWMCRTFHDQRDWVPVPRRHPKILDMVTRLFDEGGSGAGSGGGSGASTPRPSLQSPPPSETEAGSDTGTGVAGRVTEVVEGGPQLETDGAMSAPVSPIVGANDDGWRWNRNCRLM